MSDNKEMSKVKLFEPFKLTKHITLKHRVALAPLTRCRAAPKTHVPRAMSAVYYSQRASEGGLLITAGTSITPGGRGTPFAPGIYSEEQIVAYKEINDLVHAQKGFIFCQLWHVGRASHPAYQPDGRLPIAPSPIRRRTGQVRTEELQSFDYPVPREATLDEVKELVGLYGQAAKNSIAAGFDGVEIHSANGYLIDQFLHDISNQRTDEYGGSIENRARFLFEVIQSVVEGVGGDPQLVGVRLSPFGTFGDMGDSNEAALYEYVIPRLDELGLAYVHLHEPRWDKAESETLDVRNAFEYRKLLKKTPLITAGGYNRKTAIEVVDQGFADVVAFGKYFISNPDLPLRLKLGVNLTPYDRSTFYTQGVQGYTDYPFHFNVESQLASSL
jgi:N-ethylmaleimide reductase